MNEQQWPWGAFVACVGLGVVIAVMLVSSFSTHMFVGTFKVSSVTVNEVQFNAHYNITFTVDCIESMPDGFKITGWRILPETNPLEFTGVTLQAGDTIRFTVNLNATTEQVDAFLDAQPPLYLTIDTTNSQYHTDISVPWHLEESP